MTRDGLYRDPLASLRSHVDSLRDALPARGVVLSPLRRAVLPEETVRALSLAYASLEKELTEATDLTQAERDVLALRDAIAQAETLVVARRREARQPLAIPKPPFAVTSLILSSSACELAMDAVVRSKVERYDGKVGRWAPSLQAAHARFVVDELPLLLLGRTTGERTLVDVREDDSELFLRAPIPRGIVLHVRPSVLALGLLRRVPWVRRAVLRNPDLGDVAFDDAFSVRSPEGVAEALLVPRLRRWLMLFCEGHDLVHLRAEENYIELAWKEPYERAAPRALPHSGIALITGLAAVANEL
jgi:hypothetical protein